MLKRAVSSRARRSARFLAVVTLLLLPTPIASEPTPLGGGQGAADEPITSATPEIIKGLRENAAKLRADADAELRQAKAYRDAAARWRELARRAKDPKDVKSDLEEAEKNDKDAAALEESAAQKKARAAAEEARAKGLEEAHAAANQPPEPPKRTSPRYYVRAFQTDDTARIWVAEKLFYTSSAYNEDSGLREITELLKPGPNKIRFQLENGPQGYVYGFQLKKDDDVIFHRECGSPGVGCNNDEQRTGIVFDETVEITMTPEKTLACRPKSTGGETPPAPREVCGPDITEKVFATLDKIRRDFSANKAKNLTGGLCSALYGVKTHENAWDIVGLGPGTSPGDEAEWDPQGCGWKRKADGGTFNPWLTGVSQSCAIPRPDDACAATVQFMGTCQHAQVVNYVMWGLINKLCDFPLSDARGAVGLRSMFAEGELKQRQLDMTNIGYAATSPDQVKPKFLTTPSQFAKCQLKCPVSLPARPWLYIWRE